MLHARRHRRLGEKAGRLGSASCFWKMFFTVEFAIVPGSSKTLLLNSDSNFISNASDALIIVKLMSNMRVFPKNESLSSLALMV
jgi:hypothetical protein